MNFRLPARRLIAIHGTRPVYPWTVVPVERRAAYMAALEEASVRHDIAPFAEILGELVQAAMDGKQQAKLPT